MDYGPAPESSRHAENWLASKKDTFALFIGGKWVKPASKKKHKVLNPATGEVLGQIADANAKDVDRAVQAATHAFPAWKGLSGHQRARYLYAIARAVQKNARLFAVLESLDNGKPIRESRDIDIPLVARHFYHHAGWAQLQHQVLPDHEPIGVIGQIIPWNFPLLMLAWKIAPAIAMGNTVILKPAPYTPLTALLFADILEEVQLPPGVVNIVTGGDQTGKAIVSHPGIQKIAFTGSTEAGRHIRQATAGTGKSLTLELGGKSPYIVFDSADQDAAIEGLVDAIWFNQGQVCCAGSRLLVQENIAEDFLEALKRRMSKLVTGDSLDKGIDLGAIVDPIQHQTITEWVNRGVEEGATLFQPDISMPETGCFYPPTLLYHVAPAASVAREEIFGPVLVAMTFRTPSEAIMLANNTRYGLAGSVWSENISLALEVAHRIKAGSIWINATNLFDAAAGFGGYRESGYGREGGKEGLYAYLKPTYLRTQPTPPSNKGASSNARPSPPPGIDRTIKLYIGGKQVRPDSGYQQDILNPAGERVGSVGEGNRKDIRNAVEAAHKARGWADRTPHNRAQILFYIAENLSLRANEWVDTILRNTNAKKSQAREEVEQSISRLFSYAAWADKFGGSIQETTLKGFVTRYHDYLGVIGIACPDTPSLLGFVSLLAPAIARGNTIVIIPSPVSPIPATEMYQVFDTSDLPPGVVNIVTGDREALVQTLVDHDDVDAMWYFGTAEGSKQVEYHSASNMKRTWVNQGKARSWFDPVQGEGEEFLRQAIQVKNIWIPTGI